MSSRAQNLCVWSGIVAVILFFVGFWPLAHFFPPIAPSWDAQHIGAFYRENALGIRLGSILILFSGSLLVPFYSVISVQLKRIEGPTSPMTYTQMLSGVFALAPFIISPVVWSTAVFRPEHSDQEIQLMSDLAWIPILWVSPPALIQFVAIGITILGDCAERTLFPRWFAFFTLWCAVLGTTGLLIILFKTGPFAWDGLFGFYIPASLFGIWTFVAAVQLFKVIKDSGWKRAEVGA